MPSAPLSSVLRFLHDVVAPKLDQCSDAELLHTFANQRDETAFAALVRRHGALVLNVCRHVLGHEQDAEDAFQATFFVLARKAATVRESGSLAGFLHGVAYRLSLRAKRDAARRRKHERQAPPPRLQDTDDLVWRDVQALIEEEIERLPQKYRIPFIRCHLQGLSRAEAARELGVKEGTIWSRLSWARQRLQERLSRRGVSLSAALAALTLSDRHATAALFQLRETVVRSARAFAARETLTDAAAVRAAALAQAGMQAFAAGKGKATVLALFLLLTTTGGALFHALTPQPPNEQPQTKTPLPSNNASKPARVDVHGDPLPDGAVARLGTVRFRMSGLVYACAFSPDGKTLAASSVDKSVVFFDAATGRQLQKLQGNSSAATSLAYAPDGRTLATGAENGTIAIWNCATAKMVRQFRASDRGPIRPVWSLRFTPDGKGLISAGEDKTIHLWDPATGKEVRRFAGHEKDVRCALLSPDGRTLISAAGEEIRLWETATGRPIRRLAEHKKPIRSMAISADGKLLASGSTDGQIYIWVTDSGAILRRIPEDVKQTHRATSWHSLAFSPDAKILAAGGSDRGGSDYRLNLLYTDTGSNHVDWSSVGNNTFEGGKYHDGGIQCLAFAPDGRKLVFGLENLIEYGRIAPEKNHTLSSHYPGTVQQILFHSDGQRLFTSSDDGDRQILEWDSTTGRQIRRLPDKAPRSQLVCFSPGGKLIAWTRLSSELLLWDTATGKVVREIPIPFKVRSPGNQQVSFSPNGKQLFVVDRSGKSAGLFDVSTGKQLLAMGPEKAGTFSHAHFSCDCRLLAIIGNRAIKFFDTSSDRVLPSISLPQDCSRSAFALSPDGRTLAMTSGEWVQEIITREVSKRVFKVRYITLWETAVGKKRGVFPSPLRIVYPLIFSPDGRLLAVAGDDRKVHLWDMLKGSWLRHWPGHMGEIQTLAFSRDGRRLASGSTDTTALIWDVSGLAKKLPQGDALSRKQLEDLWSTLADADAAKAYRAIRTLVTVADQSVPLLAERLRYKPSADAKKLASLIAQLDSEDFAVRERAATALRRFGWEAEPALRKALEGKPSLEVRQRVKSLLDGIRKQAPPPELLRLLRGIEVLEQIGTPAACKEIAALADGTTRLAREAKTALERLHSYDTQRK